MTQVPLQFGSARVVGQFLTLTLGRAIALMMLCGTGACVAVVAPITVPAVGSRYAMNETVHNAPLIVPEMLDRFGLAIQACPSAVTRTRIPKEYWHDHPRAAALPSVALSRQTLREYCAREDICDVQRVMTVTAWGVAREPNRKRIGKVLEPISTLLARARDSGIPRSTAYDRFDQALIAGLGPAFFTKLIHFCVPPFNGYILDQFTAKSFDILTDQQSSLCSKSGVVPRGRGGQRYEIFCRAIEMLADYRGLSAEQVELDMYAGRNHPWRLFVKKRWDEKYLISAR
ncbi:protein of unknown function [Aminobacter niigataensis]|nr:protein of unknown function [Aminobacter niigataensis]